MSESTQPGAPESAPAAGVSSDAQTENQLAQVANEAESTTAPDDADQTGADTEPSKAKGVQKRLDELTALRRQAERREEAAREEARHWRELAMRGQQPAQQQGQPAQQPDPIAAHVAQIVGPAPKPEDYGGDWTEEYRTAREAWSDRRSEVRAAAIAAQQVRAFQAEAAERQFQQTFSQQVDDIEKDAPGARESIAALGNKLPAQVANAIASMGADVAHYIATNPEAEARILKAPNAWAVATELGEIRATVKARRAAPVVQPTSAPPPPSRTVRGGGSAAPDFNSMSPEAFAAYRNQQEFGRR